MGERALTQEALTQAVTTYLESHGLEYTLSGRRLKIIKTTKHTFTLELDSSSFGDYTRQGLVENKKVPKPVEFHSWEQSYKNPAASSQFGMLETPDLAKFGRSDQLHAALIGIVSFVKAEGRYPDLSDDDTKKCNELAAAAMKGFGAEAINVEVEAETFAKAVKYASCSISPMAAFFGGIVA